MSSKSAPIVAAVVLIVLIIFLLFAYSYYPSSEYAAVPVDAKAAQTAASKRGKDGDGPSLSPPRETDGVWLAWKAKYEAAQNLQASQTASQSS